MATNGPKMIRNDQKLVQKSYKNGPKMVQIRPTLIQKWSKNGHKWSKDCPNMVQKRSHISICDGFISSLSAAHHQFIISSWSVHHQFIVKLGPKNITQIGLRAEGAKANGQRLIHRSINLTISKFNWSHQLCNFVLFIMFPLFKLFHVANYDQLCSFMSTVLYLHHQLII